MAQLAEQLICNQQVIGSSPIVGSMDGFPSGQRGQTVNLLLLASVVRIHLLPPYLCNKIDAHLEKLVFTSFFCVLRVKISGVKPWMLFRKKRI